APRPAAGATAAPPRSAAAPGSATRGAAASQRVYVRIDAQHEQPAVLKRLQALLAAHPGAHPTVLFYEREHRTVALNEAYRVKPSPALFGAVEQLLGEGTVRVK
ncbi:hypothetical protein, partial [Cohnella nanjingensis]